MKTLRPLFFVVSLILIIGLACSFGGSTKPTAEPTTAAEPTEPTIQEEEPTAAVEEPTEEEAPTDEPTSSDAEAYYTETFEDLDNYTYFNTGKGDDTDKSKMSLKVDNGFLVFDLKGTNLWIYVTYNQFTYKDVALELIADNRGKNTNNVSLLCRYNKDEGWYEFNISNGGLYWVYAYDSTGAIKKGYNAIANGASKAVKQGKDVNTYNVSCVDDTLTLSINGTDVKTIKDKKFRFREGKVGFSVSSFDVTPILVNVDEFTISEP